MLQVFRGWFFEQLGMYAAYHQDRRNQATHHVGVPLIVFSIILALTQVPVAQFGRLDVTAGLAVLAVLMLGYIAAVPLVGVLATVFYGIVYILADALATGSTPWVLSLAAGCFVVGWVIQFIGHVFEGRRPALTVNAIQIFMAPPFLIAEILFALGAARALEDEVRARAVKYLPAGADPKTA